MAIPIMLTPNLLERLRRVQFFGFNCGSDEVKLKNDNYKLTFALYDEAESKIGTVEQELVIPDVSDPSESRILTAVFGNLVQSSGRGNFKLDQKDGTLQIKGHKLYPMGSNMFRPRKDIALFMQVSAQNQNIQIEPVFTLFQTGEKKGDISFQPIEQSWDKKAQVWNCVYTLDFQQVPKGDYILNIGFSNQQKKLELEKSIPLKIL